MLESHGSRVIATSGWRAALDAAARQPGGVDLVLVGAALPEGSGPVNVSRLSAIHPGVKILSVSDDASRGALPGGTPRAGVELLQKLFAPGDLSRRLRQMARRSMTASARRGVLVRQTGA